MNGRMKVHLFKVGRHDNSELLETLLQRISDNKIEDRLRSVGSHEIRVENIAKSRDGYWLLDFGMLRYEHGPGRARKDQPIIGFDFEEGEAFGEETAALYDPKSGCMLVQYNHFGVRSGSIQKYLCDYDPGKANAYELAVVFDREIERKLATKTFFSKLSVSMAVSRLTAADRDAKIPLSQAIAIGGEYGARNVTLSISMGPGKHNGLDAGSIKKTLAWVKGILHAEEDAISRAEVICKENPDGIAEVLDLVQQRLTVALDDIPLGKDWRFPQKDRWSGLHRARRAWDDIIRNLK